MAVVYLVVRLHSLMDRTAVSGTAGTGSIPVGGAMFATNTLATYSALRLCVSPLEVFVALILKQLATQGFAHSTTVYSFPEFL